MNTSRTEYGAYEQASPTRDWLTHCERRRVEQQMSGLTALAMAFFCAATLAFGFFGMTHPILAKVLNELLKVTR